MGIFEIAGDKTVTDEADRFQRLLRLRDDVAPADGFRSAYVNGDDPLARGVLIGQEIEDRTVVADEAVVGIRLAEQFHHR